MRATPPAEQHSFDPFNFAESPAWGVESGAGLESQGLVSPSAVAGLGLAAMMAMPEEAMAKGGEYGLAEGRIISMAHPIIMGGCFLVSLGAGYTGLQVSGRVEGRAGERGSEERVCVSSPSVRCGLRCGTTWT